MSKQIIEADKENAIKAYREAGEKEKLLLENLFGKKIFAQPPSDWMDLWNNFCRQNKLKVKLHHANPKNPDEEWDNASLMLRHIFKIRRGDWKPDFKNKNQNKWFPVFEVSGSGFAFSHSHTHCWPTNADVGSRLCLPTEKMSNDIAVEFLPIFEKFHTNQ